MELTLTPVNLKRLAENWLHEDTPALDFAGMIVGDKKSHAKLICKEEGSILAGKPFVNAIFDLLDCNVEWKIDEGSAIFETPRIVAIITGSANKILLGERQALNCLSRASGVATKTRSILRICSSKGWSGRLAATRKTTPGFRMVEKYAVLIGGGDSHRYDLSSMIMLKDNHVTACQGKIDQAIRKTREVCGFSMKIEVEARDDKEARQAATSGADIIMLDNFEPQNAKSIAKELKIKHKGLLIEASGGIDEDNIASYCDDFVDIISMGLLTHGYPSTDFSMKLIPM